MKTPAQILWETADVIDDGWLQGRFSDGKGRYCVLGAIAKAVCVDPTYVDPACGAYMPAEAILAAQMLARAVGQQPATWNDAEGQTATEVSLTLRTLALQLDFQVADNDGAFAETAVARELQLV